MARDRWLFFVLTGLAGLMALGIAMSRPVSVPMPGYLDDIREWAATGHIADTFTPLAYPMFAGPAYRVAGIRAVALLQAGLLVGLLALTIRALGLLGVSARWAAFGSLLVFFHPDLLLSITKIWDVELSTALLVLVVALLLVVVHRGPTLRLGIGLGAAIGAAVFCRPNYVLLGGPVLYALWGTRSQQRVRQDAVEFLGCLATVSVATFALLGLASHGRPFFPRNGPYNLYAGTNPYSAAALLGSLNAEPSIRPALEQSNPGLVPAQAEAGGRAFFSPALQRVYLHESWNFVAHHPVQEAGLIGLKLWTLFRPDTKVHALWSVAGLFQAVLALPVFMLLFLIARERGSLDGDDRLLLLVYAAYILPFLLTNSDPRFRTPLDALLLLHIVRLVSRRAPVRGGRPGGGIAAASQTYPTKGSLPG